MSFSVDANILVYASVPSSPFHPKASRFVAECAEGTEIMALAWITAMAYLRIVTNAAILSAPLTPQEAKANIEALLALPHVRPLAEREGFWKTFDATTSARPIRGNLVTDAHLASILRQHDVRVLYTNDVDFRRFDFLEARNPLA